MTAALFYFIKAWVIGIAIAAPVGPIGMLCIRNTLSYGLQGAILVGLGAALADGIYGCIAAFGLSAISHFLLEHTALIKTIGGLFLLYLAYQEAKNTNPTEEVTLKNKTHVQQVIEIFFLTLTNPMTILSFIGIFASISGGPATIAASASMVIGIFVGSMTWWLILGGIIVKIKHTLSPRGLHVVNYFSAFILAAFGVAAIFISRH